MRKFVLAVVVIAMAWLASGCAIGFSIGCTNDCEKHRKHEKPSVTKTTEKAVKVNCGWCD